MWTGVADALKTSINCCVLAGRETERDREIERPRDKETEKQRYRKTETRGDGETERQTEC